MNIIDVLLAELEQEAQATERVLKCVPQAHLSWRPHPKSYSLGQLALHVAANPGKVAQLAATDTASTPPTGAQAEAATAAELVPTMKASIARARELLGGFDDAAMTATWRMMVGGNEVMAMPRAALVRMVMLNHWYHHRGQLMVYLRMHDVPLPSVYGPTADSNPFAS
ncbi:MAG: DinB family protein [Gemmatimonadaceae bacterium]|nr:DinB family protein [Gemmatimonadaceae bacterium]